MSKFNDLIPVICKNCTSTEHFEKEEYDKLTKQEKDYCIVCTYRSPSISEFYEYILKEKNDLI